MSESFDEQSLARKFHDHKIPIRQSSLPDNEYEGDSKILMNLNDTNSERYKNLLKPSQVLTLNQSPSHPDLLSRDAEPLMDSPI